MTEAEDGPEVDAQCPKCGAVVTAEAEAFAGPAECPNCGETVQFSLLEAETEGEPAAAPTAEPVSAGPAPQELDSDDDVEGTFPLGHYRDTMPEGLGVIAGMVVDQLKGLYGSEYRVGWTCDDDAIEEDEVATSAVYTISISKGMTSGAIAQIKWKGKREVIVEVSAMSGIGFFLFKYVAPVLFLVAAGAVGFYLWSTTENSAKGVFKSVAGGLVSGILAMVPLALTDFLVRRMKSKEQNKEDKVLMLALYRMVADAIVQKTQLPGDR